MKRQEHTLRSNRHVSPHVLCAHCCGDYTNASAILPSRSVDSRGENIVTRNASVGPWLFREKKSLFLGGGDEVGALVDKSSRHTFCERKNRVGTLFGEKKMESTHFLGQINGVGALFGKGKNHSAHFLANQYIKLVPFVGQTKGRTGWGGTSAILNRGCVPLGSLENNLRDRNNSSISV